MILVPMEYNVVMVYLKQMTRILHFTQEIWSNGKVNHFEVAGNQMLGIWKIGGLTQENLFSHITQCLDQLTAILEYLTALLHYFDLSIK